MNTTMTRILATIVLSFGFGIDVALAAETYTVSAGETFELASDGAANSAGNRLDISGSATLKLTGAVNGDVFPLRLDLRFTSDADDIVLTVDASEVAGCTALRMTGNIRDNSGSARIALPASVDEVVIGSGTRGAGSALSFPALEPDVSFAGTGRVVFTNDAAVVKLPTCTWAVAEGGRLATLGPRVFGGGDFSVVDYDVELCNPGTFAPYRTVDVSAGRMLYIRPCVFSNDGNGIWIGTNSTGGDGSGYITNNIVLGGTGAQVSYQNNNDIYGVNGDITGVGDVYIRGNGNIDMRGGFDWEGSLTVGNLSINRNAVYSLHPTNNATITPAIVVNHACGGDIRIYPDGYADGPVAARATSIAGNGATRFTLLSVHANLELTVGEISGSVRVQSIGSGAGARLVVESLAANATLYLRPDVALAVNSVGAGSKIVLESAEGESEEWSVSGPSSGNAIEPEWEFPENAAASTLTLGGRLAFPSTTPLPFGKVTILDGAVVSANIADGTKIVNEGGTLTQLVTTWRDKVTLWTDASDESTFTSAKADFPAYASVIDANRVSEWRDRRADRQGDGSYRFRLTAFDGNEAAITATSQGGFPITNVIGGLRAVRCTRNRGRMQVATGKGAAASLVVKYALFVFNSYDGGGNAFFCTPDGTLKRVATATDSATVGQKPLIYADDSSAFSFRTNGVDVASPTETYTTGGWQIISFANENGVTINNIGHAQTVNTASDNGGQIYAEILLFGELPTEEEREAAETYLARKWNLPLGHEDVVQRSSVNVELAGSGMVSLASDAVAANGAFSGTVALNGHRLELSTNALPYTEATLPAADRVLWVDPSAAGAIDYSTEEGKTDEVAYLYSRDNSGVIKGDAGYYLTSPYVAGGADRRVRGVTGSRAEGPALPWLVFAQRYNGDTAGNHLIVRSLPAGPMAAYTDAATEIDVKAGFFALDTTDGGGTVIATRANGSGDFALRQSRATEPIFKSTCSDAVQAADGWLDDIAISPSNTTYRWQPEVFAFNMQPDAVAAKAKVIGFYGQGNNEVIGEFVLYSATQTEAVRKGISAYLMKKWLGRMHEGFSDFREMTVTGDGTLAAVGPEYLPELTSAFTGTLEFSRAEWSFRLPTDGGNAAVDAVDLSGRTVALPAAVTVDLDVTGAEPGEYLLMAVGAFAEGTTFVPGAVTGLGGRRIQLVAEATGLKVGLLPKGISISIR